ncbi:hypothetical protein CPter291_0945 [Collimonas pratensis]|uniref:Uncharacterized protein n=1 Tax=Collimonas pratensis TaxID=279113 RepID=A0ABM5Z2C2_9BURK|nr:hypothetical protein CPter291_0945 [Collimonas pratensis]
MHCTNFQRAHKKNLTRLRRSDFFDFRLHSVATGTVNFG